MRTFGLQGRSFVPLVLGFGCTVPAIMATRTIESDRDRAVTIMVLPLMSCSARLPIYALLIPAFFPKFQALVMYELTRLKKIEVNTSSTTYLSDNGHLFDKEKKVMIQYMITNEQTEYTIPSSVESIKTRAFRSATYLKTINVEMNNQHLKSDNGIVYDMNQETIYVHQAIAKSRSCHHLD